MATCKSCPAAVVWHLTTKGRSMPIDPTPSPDGNIRLAPTVGDNQRRAQVLGGVDLAEARMNDEVLYTSHFATCESPEAHRRRAQAGAR